MNQSLVDQNPESSLCETPSTAKSAARQPLPGWPSWDVLGEVAAVVFVFVFFCVFFCFVSFRSFVCLVGCFGVCFLGSFVVWLWLFVV